MSVDAACPLRSALLYIFRVVYCHIVYREDGSMWVHVVGGDVTNMEEEDIIEKNGTLMISNG